MSKVKTPGIKKMTVQKKTGNKIKREVPDSPKPCKGKDIDKDRVGFWE